MCMPIYTKKILCVVAGIAGIALMPFISRASFSDDLRRIHEQSQDERDMRREQFKQDVLEKRKEMLTKWHDKKQEIKDRLKEEQNKLTSDFEIHRMTATTSASSSTLWKIQQQGREESSDFLSILKKSAKDIVHSLLPFPYFFGN